MSFKVLVNIHDKKNKTRKLKLDKGEYTLGNDESSDIVVDDE